jgi:hypothetical protein
MRTVVEKAKKKPFGQLLLLWPRHIYCYSTAYSEERRRVVSFFSLLLIKVASSSRGRVDTHTQKGFPTRPIRQDKGLGYVYFSLASGSHVTARARVTAYLGICVYRDTHQQQQRSYISHIARKNDRNNSLFAPAQYIKWTSGSV